MFAPATVTLKLVSWTLGDGVSGAVSNGDWYGGGQFSPVVE